MRFSLGILNSLGLIALGNLWVSSVAAQAKTATERPDLKQAMTGGVVQCTNGKAKGFDCQKTDLLAYLPAHLIGVKDPKVILNDIWGWIDSVSKREFAIVGRSDGTSFIEVTDPLHPKYLGNLPTHQGAQVNYWRGVKVYKNHAFIVADEAGPHGMQIFDLTQLRTVKRPPVEFRETAHYNRINSAHTITINESTGFAYVAGNSMGGMTCGGGLHMVDIRAPTKPVFAGCYADPKTGQAGTGYVHDTECLVYHGPDARYKGREICLNSSENALGIADVTQKKTPKTISIVSYPTVAYAHQGWLTDDHRYFFMGDEEDDGVGGIDKTRTMVFDLYDLDDPIVLTEFYGTTAATDHNLYLRGHYMFQSNYSAGLRVIDVRDPRHGKEVGYFDTSPYGKNTPTTDAGSWSNFPYFKDGVVGVTSMTEGFFLVRFRP